MKPACFTAIILALLLSSASAHTRHHHVLVDHRYTYMNRGAWVTHEVPGARPHAWCGWFMRQIKGVTDTAYNLAHSWVHWGSPAGGPRDYAVVVWPHHVGELVPGECPKGAWMVHSGNDGHAERTRCRSLRGAIAFRV